MNNHIIIADVVIYVQGIRTRNNTKSAFEEPRRKKPDDHRLLDPKIGEKIPKELALINLEFCSLETRNYFQKFLERVELKIEGLDHSLQEWLRLALLGVCQGFSERNLDPELP